MMKGLILGAATALILVGCASDDHRHRRTTYYYDNNPDIVVEQGDGRRVIIEQDRDRTYVREHDAGYHRESAMQPRYRGKHPEALGWNDPYWYSDRRY